MNSEKNELQIVAYPDMSEMPEERLQKLAAKEREWFGYGMEGRGFGEYAICSDPHCRRIISVEEAYPLVNETPEKYIPLAELEKDGINLPCCPDCNGKMEPLLDPGYFPEYLRLYFSQKVYGALLMQDEEVKGAVSAFNAPFEQAFESNVNYRKGYKIDEALEKIAEITGKTPDEIRSQVITACNRIALDKSVRGHGKLFDLIKTALNQFPENDEFPSLGDAKIFGPVFPLACAVGDIPIMEDAHGNSLFYSPRFGNFRDAFNLSPEKFKQQYGDKVEEVKKQQAARKEKEGLKPLKITGVPLLREAFNPENSSQFETKEGKKFAVETVNSAELDEKTLRQFTDFFRYIFNNTFAGQFLVYPSEGIPISTQDVFGANPDEFVPIENLDQYDPSQYPTHPETGEKAVFWHDPEVTFQTFLEKAKQDAHFALIRNQETGEIAGIMFGHKCSIKDLFSTEEWENPLLYSGVQNPENMRDFNKFLKKLNEELEKKGLEKLDPESEVYGWNCIATHPDVRGLEYLTQLTQAFFGMIPQEMKDNLLIVGETKANTRAHALFKTAGGVDITGILTQTDEIKKGDPVIIVGDLDYASKIFSLTKEEFEQLMKN